MPKTSSSTSIPDLEILPPEGGAGKSKFEKQGTSQAAKNVARWLDDLIVIPGTNFKIGLDPILGLIPGVGDLFASSMGLVLLLDGIRTGMPISGLARMGINILINNAVGSIPVAGDIFSAFWKSNSRNLKLLQRWQSGEQASVRRGSYLFLGVFIIIWLAFIAGSIWISLSILKAMAGLF